jgi:hypothetical protein
MNESGGYAKHLNQILMQKYLDSVSMSVRLEAKVIELSEEVKRLESLVNGDE